MSRMGWTDVAPVALAAGLALLVAGCGSGSVEDKGTQAHNQPATQQEHDHSGWWCDEHGVPEEICGQCNAKYAAECKEKGDWCKEHDRPESQCFICHPKLKEKFAAQYRKKYGKEPPPIKEETPKDKGANQ